MNKYALDTMAIVLWMENRRLPAKIRNIFEQAENGKIEINIPMMVIAEIGYLSEKNRIETNISEVQNYCIKHNTINIAEMTLPSVLTSFKISDIPELHDRLIAGYASDNNIPLLTNDGIIIKSDFVETIWFS